MRGAQHAFKHAPSALVMSLVFACWPCSREPCFLGHSRAVFCSYKSDTTAARGLGHPVVSRALLLSFCHFEHRPAAEAQCKPKHLLLPQAETLVSTFVMGDPGWMSLQMQLLLLTHLQIPSTICRQKLLLLMSLQRHAALGQLSLPDPAAVVAVGVRKGNIAGIVAEAAQAEDVVVHHWVQARLIPEHP